MPTNFKDAERMLRDFQNLLPQIVGSIVAVVSAIAVIVGLLNDAGVGGSDKSSDLPGVTENQTPGTTDRPGLNPAPSKPVRTSIFTVGTNYAPGVNADVPVNFNGKSYDRSVISTAGNDWSTSRVDFNVPREYNSLEFDAAFATDIPNEAGVGQINVTLDGGERKTVDVIPGQATPVRVNIAGGGTVRIYFSVFTDAKKNQSVAPNGLAILNPVISR